jgi:Na+-transporting NADH:ubiquinone oxidoreductase subunit NqrB
MALIRIALISLAAALAGCAAGSILIFGELGRASFVALPFTCIGSLLLLAPLYAAARESGVAIGPRYARLLVAGTLVGGLMLGFVFVATDPLGGAAMGSAYGALTATCWTALHALTKRLTAFMA